MQLAANNRLVRWAYWYDNRPERTSLCVLFWRSILVTPLVGLLVVVTIPLWATAMLWYKYGEKPCKAWARRRAQASYDKRLTRLNVQRDNPPDPSALKILWLGLLAVKRKFCPIVDFY